MGGGASSRGHHDEDDDGSEQISESRKKVREHELAMKELKKSIDQAEEQLRVERIQHKKKIAKAEKAAELAEESMRAEALAAEEEAAAAHYALAASNANTKKREEDAAREIFYFFQTAFKGEQRAAMEEQETARLEAVASAEQQASWRSEQQALEEAMRDAEQSASQAQLEMSRCMQDAESRSMRSAQDAEMQKRKLEMEHFSVRSEALEANRALESRLGEASVARQHHEREASNRIAALSAELQEAQTQVKLIEKQRAMEREQRALMHAAAPPPATAAVVAPPIAPAPLMAAAATTSTPMSVQRDEKARAQLLACELQAAKQVFTAEQEAASRAEEAQAAITFEAEMELAFKDGPGGHALLGARVLRQQLESDLALSRDEVWSLGGPPMGATGTMDASEESITRRMCACAAHKAVLQSELRNTKDPVRAQILQEIQLVDARLWQLEIDLFKAKANALEAGFSPSCGGLATASFTATGGTLASAAATCGSTASSQAVARPQPPALLPATGEATPAALSPTTGGGAGTGGASLSGTLRSPVPVVAA